MKCGPSLKKYMKQKGMEEVPEHDYVESVRDEPLTNKSDVPGDEEAEMDDPIKGKKRK